MPCRVPKRRFSCGAPQHLTKNLFKGGLELLMHLKGAPLASKINIPIVVAGLEQLFHLTFRRFTGIGRGAGI